MIVQVEEDYEDRGMMKWQGFILTEHEEELLQLPEFKEIVKKVDVYWD
ncbi:hypothetical protein OL233_06165 [Vagococcus sp. PNs007]|uniref:Uncharacterized protein n=1 Tax=Vagococcus proximus TaxID=2991417 RepID=A0ABT5X1J5_9ENTE|nr:hypothetical protein [Vagococcus proximus]MDF0479873.1 hypothetical protein [Vagococcus proximus]